MNIHPITHKTILFMKYFIGETIPKEVSHPIRQSQSQIFGSPAIATLNITDVTWSILILLMK